MPLTRSSSITTGLNLESFFSNKTVEIQGSLAESSVTVVSSLVLQVSVQSYLNLTEEI